VTTRAMLQCRPEGWSPGRRSIGARCHAPGRDACGHSVSISASTAPCCYDLIVVRRPDLGQPLVEAIEHLNGRPGKRRDAMDRPYMRSRAIRGITYEGKGGTVAVAVRHHSKTADTYRTGPRCGLHWHYHRMVLGHGSSVLIVKSAACVKEGHREGE
jgi:hypothetical protein